MGWETDYKEAMERLKRFYGDPVKVISCVMKEIMSQQLINYGEYRNLVTYCSNLERNFNRLKSLGFEHEERIVIVSSVVVTTNQKIASEKQENVEEAEKTVVALRIIICMSYSVRMPSSVLQWRK